jgi:hypothetical protein
MSETCRVIYDKNEILASSWYLSSFSYMMHGHTYIKEFEDCVCDYGLTYFSGLEDSGPPGCDTLFMK